MRRLEILFVILLLLVGCHKKRGSNPVSAPAPTPEKIEIKKVEDLCETGTLDDLFVKNCTTNQKRSFIERNYGVLDCNNKDKLDCDKIYGYIIDYDDLDLYKELVVEEKSLSKDYINERFYSFNERCYDKKSSKIGRLFFKEYALEFYLEKKISKKTIDIYNYYLDLGVDVDEENILNKGTFENSLVHHFLTETKIESAELDKDYQKLIRRIIRSSEYFFPVLSDENKLSLNEMRDFIKQMCSAGRVIPVVELLNTIGPVVSEDVLIHPQRYSSCLLKTETLEALLSPFNKEEIKGTGLSGRFLKELMYSASVYFYGTDFYVKPINGFKFPNDSYQKNKAMDIVFNYFSLEDFFVKDNKKETDGISLPPFSYVDLKILKILLIKISKDRSAIENLRRLAKELYDSKQPLDLEENYKLRYKAILKFIENQERGLKFIDINELSDVFLDFN